MHSFAIATLLLAACAVNADIITVAVGQDGFSFTPITVNANVGDTVSFHFYGTHTATQSSSFLNPCTALSGGFDSNTQSNGASIDYTVKSDQGLYFHCSIDKQCHDHGMVFGINVPNDIIKNFRSISMSGNSNGWK